MFKVVFKGAKKKRCKKKKKNVAVHLHLPASWVLIQDLWASSVSRGTQAGTQKCLLRESDPLFFFSIIMPSSTY